MQTSELGRQCFTATATGKTRNKVRNPGIYVLDRHRRSDTLCSMRTPPVEQKDTSGFTLIELLVVITIVAILAGIFLPVYGSVMNSTRKTQVTSDEKNLILAVNTYRADYGRQPASQSQIAGAQNTGYDTVFGDGQQALYKNFKLMNVLRAIADDDFNKDDVLNPSKTVYYQGQLVKNNNDPHDGILTADHNDGVYTLTKGSFVDPWGAEYLIWLDLNSDQDLTKATKWFYTIPDTQIVHGTVQVGSVGPDGDFGSARQPGVLAGSDDMLMAQ